MAPLQRVAAVDGWFTLDEDAPCLIGGRCGMCGVVVFGRTVVACPNPQCEGTELEAAELGRTGRVWSFATNHYAPPAPYIAAEPFEPYTLAAVELARERIVVLGQLADGVEPAGLSIGQEVEVTLRTLYADDERSYLMWAWRPVAAAS